MKKISVVIPVYNNEASLNSLSNRLKQTIQGYNSNFTYEFIFVNDGSLDQSLTILKEIQLNDKNIIVINLSRNFGQMAGILAGWKYATGDAIINMSADLQDPPEQIALMLREWESGNEIVINYRESRNDASTSAFTSKIANSLFRFTLPNMPAGGFDYVLLDRKALDAVDSITERNRFYQGDILWVGFNIKYLPYVRLKREHGKSGYNFSKRFGYFMTAFLNVSYFPIRVMSLLGFITATIGFIYSIAIIYSYFIHKTPFQGWAPIMMVLLIIGGLLMIMLGIVGEYIWRIYDEVKHKPNYIIKDIHSSIHIDKNV